MWARAIARYPRVTDGTGCSWAYTEMPFVPTGDSPALIAAYGSGEYADLQADLVDPSWPSLNNGVTPSSSAAVITSLDLEQASVLFAVSWTQTTQLTAFDRHMSSVTPQNLQAAATQEGAAARVITAVSDDNGQVVYLSYGWQSDTATLYEAQVVTTVPSGAVAAATNLAARVTSSLPRGAQMMRAMSFSLERACKATLCLGRSSRRKETSKVADAAAARLCQCGGGREFRARVRIQIPITISTSGEGFGIHIAGNRRPVYGASSGP